VARYLPPVPDDRHDDEPASGGWLPPTGGDAPITPSPAEPSGAAGGWLPPSESSYVPPPPQPEPSYAPPPPRPPAASGWAGQPAPTYQQTNWRESHGRAGAALVGGIVGLVVCPIVFSVIAIVLGTQARREIDAAPERYGNRGQAQWGVNLGWIGLAFGIVLLVLALTGEIVLTPEG